jgi:hypothetical protein
VFLGGRFFRLRHFDEALFIICLSFKDKSVATTRSQQLTRDPSCDSGPPFARHCQARQFRGIEPPPPTPDPTHPIQSHKVSPYKVIKFGISSHERHPADGAGNTEGGGSWASHSRRSAPSSCATPSPRTRQAAGGGRGRQQASAGRWSASTGYTPRFRTTGPTGRDSDPSSMPLIHRNSSLITLGQRWAALRILNRQFCKFTFNGSELNFADGITPRSNLIL